MPEAYQIATLGSYAKELDERYGLKMTVSTKPQRIQVITKLAKIQKHHRTHLGLLLVIHDQQLK
jgi:hypothetical protein